MRPVAWGSSAFLTPRVAGKDQRPGERDIMVTPARQTLAVVRVGLEVEIDALATLKPDSADQGTANALDRLDPLESTRAYRVASRLWRLLRYRN